MEGTQLTVMALDARQLFIAGRVRWTVVARFARSCRCCHACFVAEFSTSAIQTLVFSVETFCWTVCTSWTWNRIIHTCNALVASKLACNKSLFGHKTGSINRRHVDTLLALSTLTKKKRMRLHTFWAVGSSRTDVSLVSKFRSC